MHFDSSATEETGRLQSALRQTWSRMCAEGTWVLVTLQYYAAGLFGIRGTRQCPTTEEAAAALLAVSKAAVSSAAKSASKVECTEGAGAALYSFFLRTAAGPIGVAPDELADGLVCALAVDVSVSCEVRKSAASFVTGVGGGLPWGVFAASGV